MNVQTLEIIKKRIQESSIKENTKIIIFVEGIPPLEFEDEIFINHISKDIVEIQTTSDSALSRYYLETSKIIGTCEITSDPESIAKLKEAEYAPRFSETLALNPPKRKRKPAN